MGFSPADIDAMSVWQFEAVCAGYAKQFDDGKGMTDREADELFDWIKSKDDVPVRFVH